MGTFMKSGQAWLYDEDTGDIVGVKDRDGGESFFGRLSTDANGNTVLVGAGVVIPLSPPTYTWATRPNPATSDLTSTIRISDVGVSAFGSLWYTDGTRWRPVGDRLVLGNVALAGTTNGTNVETIGYELEIPAGLLQSGDEISVAPYLFREGGTSDTSVVSCRHGTVSGTLGTFLGQNMTQPSTTTLRTLATWAWRKASATLLTYVSPAGANGGGGSSLTAQAEITVADMDTQATYIQITTKLGTGGTETLTLKSCPVILHTY